MKKWAPYIDDFKAYLTIERNLSKNSIDAYLADVEKLALFIFRQDPDKGPIELLIDDFEAFASSFDDVSRNTTFAGWFGKAKTYMEELKNIVDWCEPVFQLDNLYLNKDKTQYVYVSKNSSDENSFNNKEDIDFEKSIKRLALKAVKPVKNRLLNTTVFR